MRGGRISSLNTGTRRVELTKGRKEEAVTLPVTPARDTGTTRVQLTRGRNHSRNTRTTVVGVMKGRARAKDKQALKTSIGETMRPRSVSLVLIVGIPGIDSRYP